MMRSLSPLLSCLMQGSRIAVAVVLVLLAVFVFFLVFWLVRRRRRNAFQVSPFPSAGTRPLPEQGSKRSPTISAQ